MHVHKYLGQPLIHIVKEFPYKPETQSKCMPIENREKLGEIEGSDMKKRQQSEDPLAGWCDR